MTLNEDGSVTFDAKEREIGRVVFARQQAYKETQAMRCWGTLMILHEDTEYEITFSCAPWLMYLNDSIMAMAETPEQRYEGFHLLTSRNERGVFHNLMGLTGIQKPADWDEQLASMGIASTRPAANNKPPAKIPGGRPAEEM